MFLDHTFIHTVVIIKGHETESLLFSGSLVFNHLYLFDIAETGKGLLYLIFGRVLVEAADKHLVHCHLVFLGLISRHSTFRVNFLAIDHVGSFRLSSIKTIGILKSDETKSFRAVGWRILHNYAVNDFTPLLKMGFQRFLSGVETQATDEEFAKFLVITAPFWHFVCFVWVEDTKLELLAKPLLSLKQRYREVDFMGEKRAFKKKK